MRETNHTPRERSIWPEEAAGGAQQLVLVVAIGSARHDCRVDGGVTIRGRAEDTLREDDVDGPRHRRVERVGGPRAEVHDGVVLVVEAGLRDGLAVDEKDLVTRLEPPRLARRVDLGDDDRDGKGVARRGSAHATDRDPKPERGRGRRREREGVREDARRPGVECRRRRTRGMRRTFEVSSFVGRLSFDAREAQHRRASGRHAVAHEVCDLARADAAGPDPERLVVDRGERVAGGDGPAELALFRNRAHDDAVRARPVVGGARDAQVECRRSEAAGAGRRCRDRDDEVARRDTRPDDARRRSRRRGARRAAHEAHRDGPRERAERSEHAVRLRPRVRRRGLVRRNARRVDDDDRA
mmetsp:Transcript_11584/g.46853  ORF Transcript_11584/g.46853 Transcript_11584/m.46853 type:complete len:355 (+) Transcript_11584:242-1306(+)